jgi:hypothetical protein
VNCGVVRNWRVRRSNRLGRSGRAPLQRVENLSRPAFRTPASNIAPPSDFGPVEPCRTLLLCATVTFPALIVSIQYPCCIHISAPGVPLVPYETSIPETRNPAPQVGAFQLPITKTERHIKIRPWGGDGPMGSIKYGDTYPDPGMWSGESPSRGDAPSGFVS